jgi:hypothetical protein
MNTGQMILAMGALVLLSATVLTVNSSNLSQGTILRQTELGIYAVSLATSYIQRARTMDFDELTVGGALLARTPAPGVGVLSTTLGPDAGEILNADSTYDDFDDYNGFVIVDTVANVDNFGVRADVYYVSMVQPYPQVAGPTWLKQIDIQVRSTVSRKVFEDPKAVGDAGVDVIRLSYIYSYYQ